MRQHIPLCIPIVALLTAAVRASAQDTTVVQQDVAEVRAQFDSVALDYLAQHDTRIAPEALQVLQTQIDTAAQAIAQFTQETRQVNAERGLQRYLAKVIEEGTRVRVRDESGTRYVTIVEESDIQAALRRCASWILWPLWCDHWTR